MTFEEVVIKDMRLKNIGAKIRAYSDKLLPAHYGHKIRIYYDSP